MEVIWQLREGGGALSPEAWLQASGTWTDATFATLCDLVSGADIDVEYAYDANGNMTMDGNNGIYSIAYNALNFPKKVTFAEPGVYNEYVYSADGTKLSVLHKKASTEKRTDYVDMIYKNDSILDMILVDGGYIKDGPYHFFLQDHLGSNRVVADADGNFVQATHYYLFIFNNDGSSLCKVIRNGMIYD
jgi:hypothetical protein